MSITYDDVAFACQAILQDSKSPTIKLVREKLGRGSESTIGPLLKQWKETLPKSPSSAHIEVPQSVSNQLTLWLRAHAANACAELEQRLADAAQDQETLTRAAIALEEQLKDRDGKLATLTTERDQEAAIALEKRLEIERLLKELDRERYALNTARGEHATAQFQVMSQAERLNEFRTSLEISEQALTSVREAKSAAEVRAAVATAESRTQLKIAEERGHALIELELRHRQCQERISGLEEDHAEQLTVERKHCMMLEDEVTRLNAKIRELSDKSRNSQGDESGQVAKSS